MERVIILAHMNCCCSVNHVTGEKTYGKYCPLHKLPVKQSRIDLQALWIRASKIADRKCGYGDENLWQQTANDEYRKLLANEQGSDTSKV